MSKITPEARERMVAHNLQDQLMAKVEHLMQERRKRNEYVMTERRGLNPQRKGFEEWSDVDFALRNDRGGQ